MWVFGFGYDIPTPLLACFEHRGWRWMQVRRDEGDWCVHPLLVVVHCSMQSYTMSYHLANLQEVALGIDGRERTRLS